MRTIMYHYVRHYNDKLFNMHYLDVRNFARQLNMFESDGFVTRDEFFKFVDGGCLVEPDKTLLTFDDGFFDHAHYVLPMLRERNIFGLFSVPTRPLVDPIVLPVHKVHYLVARCDPKGLIDEAIDILGSDSFEDRPLGGMWNYEKRFKHLMTHQLGLRTRDYVVGVLFDRYFYEEDLHSRLYLDEKDVKVLQSDGHVVCNHSHSHNFLSHLSDEDLRNDFEESEKVFSSLLPHEFNHLCYVFPYGTRGCCDSRVLNVLEGFGYRSAFMATTEEHGSPPEFKKFFNTRIDCNVF